MADIVEYNNEDDIPPKGNSADDRIGRLKYLWLLISEIGDITRCYCYQYHEHFKKNTE